MWGYSRIQGALKNVGHRVVRSTIARVLKAHGLPPVPERPTSWQTFLRAHWGAIAGADLFTTEVWTWRGLVTYDTAFVIDLASRRVQILGCTPHPDDVQPQLDNTQPSPQLDNTVKWYRRRAASFRLPAIP